MTAVRMLELLGSGRKAEVLDALRPLLNKARILPSLTLSRASWRQDAEAALDLVEERDWAALPLIVRSSASFEDSETSSAAGHFYTQAQVLNRTQLHLAVDRVFASYDQAGLRDDHEHVLLQPMVIDALSSGVAASRDHLTGGPYRVISWSTSGRTDDVTKGRVSDIRTWYEAVSVRPTRMPTEMVGVVSLLDELEIIVGRDFEIEFAISPTWGLALFQVRRLARMRDVTPEAIALLAPVASRVAAVLSAATEGDTARPIPGGPTVLGIMPDWNPAEVIGTRPRRSATSLYQYLVTDRVWAEARAAYGYRNLGATPLMVDLGGLPYVDVRASAASLVPATVSLDTTARLIDHYVRDLVDAPHLHDKFEFQVVLSAWVPGADRWLSRLDPVLDEDEKASLKNALRELTDDLVVGMRPWVKDLAALDQLEAGRAAANEYPPGSVERIAALLDSTRRDGTRPFAGLARAAFVATQILYGAVAEGHLSSAAQDAFLASASLVTSELVADLSTLGLSQLADRYGHLRQGTYDLLSLRYDECPDTFLAAPRWPTHHPTRVEEPDLGALDRVLTECGLAFGAESFRDFAMQCVRGRELAKLRFTRNLSDALVELTRWGETRGLDRDDVSHLTLGAVLGDYDTRTLRALIAEGRAEHARAALVVLPPILYDAHAVWSFEMPSTEPNFITGRRVIADVADIAAGVDPQGRIALISSADPGYDWIFGHGIRGLVTAYGGVNSHMAIRAREFELPSAIGVGEARFQKWRTARALDLNAGTRVVRVLP